MDAFKNVPDQLKIKAVCAHISELAAKDERGLALLLDFYEIIRSHCEVNNIKLSRLFPDADDKAINED